MGVTRGQRGAQFPGRRVTMGRQITMGDKGVCKEVVLGLPPLELDILRKVY